MNQFIYCANPSRVLFGSGTSAQLAEEISAMGCSRALIISTPQQADLAEKTCIDIGPLATGVFTEAAMHTPVAVTCKALKSVEQTAADCLVAVGGGSTIGLSKAIALRSGLPQIAIPTTYAGSEMTPILGQTEDGVKTTQRTMKVLPEVVIYDVDLTLTLPIALSVTSGINAMAHAVEALYAENRNPVISMLAEEGIRALYRTLDIISDRPSDIKVRSDALFGAWLCGTSLGSVGMALHHKLCHTLGGTFDLPHAETHTVLLPHVTAFNAVAVPELDVLGHKLNGTSLAVSISELAKRAGAPLSLAAIGMPKDGLDRAAELAVSNPYFNPRDFSQGDIRELLENAFHGTPLEQ